MKYVGSMIAFTNAGQYRMAPLLIEANNKDEANGMAMRLCREAYTYEEGFLNHNVSCDSLSELEAQLKLTKVNQS